MLVISFFLSLSHIPRYYLEELDDIIRYGSKELFADENDEAGKLRQIHYDDAAIDRLLNRDQVVDEDAAVDDEEEDSFLKAFKVANFEYIEEAEATPEEDILIPPLENKATVLNSERATYWEELLRDRYEMHKVEEFNGMGKGKRSRKQMVSVEDDDLAGLEEVTSDGEDDNYEADLSDGETALPGAPVVRRPYRKRARVDSSIPLPLMEGEGKSFRVLGFNQSQRAAFVKVLMRFGVGDYDWAEFTPRLKQKTYEEIKDYGTLFLSHIAEDITESPTFTDGVPKEGLRIPDVLVRIAVLLLIRDKVKAFSEETKNPLFAKDIVSWFPGLKGGRVWKEDHDLLLLRAVLKKGVVGPVARDVEEKSAAQVMCPVLGQQRDENLNTKKQTLKVSAVLFTEAHILISNQFNVLRNTQDDLMLAEVEANCLDGNFFDSNSGELLTQISEEIQQSKLINKTNSEEGDTHEDAMTNIKGEGTQRDSFRDKQDMQLMELIETDDWNTIDAEPLNIQDQSEN
ncbi:hypothetical protein HAX54_039255 [Datura stramonium]|uniref:Uncharacterized protein n=1 Tax=Datura stramonium TaxID=4076 RepID=A0ABS8VNE5_DATST|nr:hypothetical protein [Datura stramonium]